jgi:hypothetical protein
MRIGLIVEIKQLGWAIAAVVVLRQCISGLALCRLNETLHGARTNLRKALALGSRCCRGSRIELFMPFNEDVGDGGMIPF